MSTITQIMMINRHKSGKTGKATKSDMSDFPRSAPGHDQAPRAVSPKGA